MRICAGLDMVMEDCADRSHVIATLECEAHIQIGVAIVVSSDYLALRDTLKRPDTRRLFSDDALTVESFNPDGPRWPWL